MRWRRAGHDALLERVPVLAEMRRQPDAWQRQLGTLGGGNHFIELCLDEADRVWVMLHSGSRGIGNRRKPDTRASAPPRNGWQAGENEVFHRRGERLFVWVAR